jgi:hypothetical protein
VWAHTVGCHRHWHQAATSQCTRRSKRFCASADIWSARLFKTPRVCDSAQSVLVAAGQSCHPSIPVLPLSIVPALFLPYRSVAAWQLQTIQKCRCVLISDRRFEGRRTCDWMCFSGGNAGAEYERWRGETAGNGALLLQLTRTKSRCGYNEQEEGVSLQVAERMASGSMDVW